jgi:tetratricopeptide (TPR) repeat protein
MRHEDEDKGCFMNISVYPLDGEFPNADQKRVDGLRSLQDRISQQAQAIFVSSGTTRNVKVVEFFATPVFEARYVLGQGANQRDVIELRFAQGGFEYALRVGSRSAFFKEVEPWLWEALESFSFLPPVETSNKHFHDSVNGFRVTSPEGRWSLSADVFNATRPVNIVHESGQASVEVWLLPGTRTPAEIIGGAIADFKSRPGGECTVLKEDDKGRNGVQAMYRVIRGFAERATKAEEFYYLVSTRGERILRIIGRGPASGDLSGQLRDELTAFFEAARLFDADTSKAQLAEANQATERFGEGLNRFRSRDYEGAITAFGEAIALFPNFRQVYLERAKVNEQLKRWDDYRSDLERALDLEDDPELGVKVSLSFFEEGKEATAQKDYDKAVQLMTRAYRRDKKNELIENGLLQAYALYQTDRIRSKNYRDAIKTMRSGARVVKNPRMLDLLANAIVEEGKSFLQQRKPRNALSNAKDALRIVKGYAPAEALKNSAERAIEAEKK